jgi:hypothetical protein
MTDAEKLDRVCKALGFGTGSDACDNLMGASMDLDMDRSHVADELCRRTIERVVGQLAEARKLLQP